MPKSKTERPPKRPPIWKRLSRSDLNVIGVILLLMFINTASLNMLIPSYSAIILEFGIADNVIFLPDSFAVLIAAFAMVLWGYLGDKIERNVVISGGAILSTIGFIYTAFCTNFTQLLIARILTGAGLGFAIPIGISVLSDIIPAEDRSGLFGFLAIFSSISNGTGQGLAAFIGPLDVLGFGWKFPFLILSGLSILSVIILFFVKLPAVGSTEESLADLHESDEVEYGYKINQKELVKMLKKPTNRFLILNGFFSIIPGTIIIFSLITTFSHPTLGMFSSLPPEIRTQVSTIMAGMASIGYMIGSITLSGIGDVVYHKHKRNRALLAFISNVLAIPLCILFIIQLRPISLEFMPLYPASISPGEVNEYMLLTLEAIFQNYPNYIWYIVLAFLGTFFSAGMVTNKNAVMVDVNLPEHRGTATSFFQLTEQLGKSVTLMLAGVLVVFLGSYRTMLFAGMLFWIPSAIFWYKSIRSVVNDISQKELILRERAQMTFIDYVFELEMAIDDGIQLVQDFKDALISNFKRAQKPLDHAINKFTWIVQKAHRKSMSDVETRAQGLLNNAQLFKEDFTHILSSKKPDRELLQQLFEKINALWEESDFGKIEILYESAYIKVCEARLQRIYDPFECSQILQDAIDIYERVINNSSDRVVDAGIKKLSDEEKEMQHRYYRIIVNSQKSKSNTDILKSKLEQIVNTVVKEDVTRDEFETILNLTKEYGLKFQEILEDTFEKKVVRKINSAIEDIDNLFESYDKWEKNE